jgi:hypothetical protein
MNNDTSAVHFLQDKIHQAPAPAKGSPCNRPQALRRNKTYNARVISGGRKVGKQVSSIIHNPHIKHAGAGVIWNQV